MRFRLILRQTLVLAYLAISLAGLAYTVLRLKLPVVPGVLRVYAYQMMAPYQGYDTHHQDFFARGQQPDGTWEPIDLTAYFPYSRGERYIRSYLPSLGMIGRTDTEGALQSFAEQMLRREQAEGRPYRALQFGTERWPVSLEGYAALRQVPWLQTVSVVTTP